MYRKIGTTTAGATFFVSTALALYPLACRRLVPA